MMIKTMSMIRMIGTTKMIDRIMSPIAIYVIAAAVAVIAFIVFRRALLKRHREPRLIDELEGHDFEMYCPDLLRNNGFDDVTVTKGSGDFGLDILCERDGVTYGIQCKRYDKPIGVYAVQQAYAGRDYYDRMVGVVMTNQSFTDAAERAAKKLNILLWDRKEIRALEG